MKANTKPEKSMKEKMEQTNRVNLESKGKRKVKNKETKKTRRARIKEAWKVGRKETQDQETWNILERKRRKHKKLKK